MKKMRSFMAAALLLAAGTAGAAIYTVTTASNSGPGSLRQAILDANANPGADTINFNLAGGGVHTIAVTNALPDITTAVTINGYSQPGSSANTLAGGDNSVHLIRLDGFKITSGFPIGLNFSGAAAAGSSVRGLVIVRFYHGVQINEAASVTVAGNWIGLDVDNQARGMGGNGIYINSFFNPGRNNVIGGTTPADRNVISGNNYGVNINYTSSANNYVQGNFIGTDATSTLPRGNVFAGVFVMGSTNNIIGGAANGARNILSASTGAGGSGVALNGAAGTLVQNNYIGTDVTGEYDLGNVSDGVYVFSGNNNIITGNEIANNRNNGVELSGTTGNLVQNNLIGTDAAGTRALGNLLAGVSISGSTNLIGGLGAGQANTIQFNDGAGVEVTSPAAVQNEITGNSIYDNGGLGIDLYPAGINTNDVLDADAGANGLQNFPGLTNASITFSALTVQGTLNSKAGAAYRLEFFATPTWDATNIPEGKILLGATNVTTDGSGNVSFTAAFAAAPDTNYVVTATATDANGNTSEFSAGTGIAASGMASPALVAAKNAGGGGTPTTTSVSWSSAATFFSLEKTASLAPPAPWLPVTSGIVELSGTKTFTITNGGGNTNQFFRLKKP